jgi:hypothetical protein
MEKYSSRRFSQQITLQKWIYDKRKYASNQHSVCRCGNYAVAGQKPYHHDSGRY